MRFKKGSIEAKRFMAKLRASRGKKKVGAVKKKTETKNNDEYLIIKEINQNYLVDPKDKFFSPNSELAEVFNKKQAESIIKKIKGTYMYKIGSTATKKVLKKKLATKKNATKKKTATKKPVIKKLTHKDTKSHNVNIKVVSGINKNVVVDKIKQNNSIIEKFQKGIVYCETQIKRPIYNDEKKLFRDTIKTYKALIKEYKLHNMELKKHI